MRTPLVSGPVPTGLPAVRGLADRGKTAYHELCAECHGLSGAGDGPGGLAVRNAPTNFLNSAYMVQQRPTWYYRAITAGVAGTGMGSWDHRLDEGTRWDVAWYVWSLSIPPRHFREGAVRYAESCAGCHGADGRGERRAMLTAPRLAELSRRELAERLRAVHPAIVPQEEAALQAVVAHLGTFLYAPPRADSFGAVGGTAAAAATTNTRATAATP